MNSAKSAVKRVIVFASYNESANLKVLFDSLIPELSELDAIIVADDSGPEDKAQLEELLARLGESSKSRFMISSSAIKGGRGAAVRRAFSLALDEFPQAGIFIESDSDGSHRPADILKIRDWNAVDSEMVIGSRYLRESQIVGWTLTRRTLSKTLNIALPLLLNLPLKDVTNGLRRYSRGAVQHILKSNLKNSGFIYLSEVAQLLHSAGFKISEIPIVFDDRMFGTSSVTWKELNASLRGVFGLVRGKLF